VKKKERIEILSISKQMMIDTIDNIANEFLTIYCFSQENHVLIYHNKIIFCLYRNYKRNLVDKLL